MQYSALGNSCMSLRHHAAWIRAKLRPYPLPPHPPQRPGLHFAADPSQGTPGAELDLRGALSSEENEEVFYGGSLEWHAEGWGGSRTHADTNTLNVDLHEMQMEGHGFLPFPFFL